MIQGNDTVFQYEAKFARLSRFAKSVVADEAMKVMRFVFSFSAGGPEFADLQGGSGSYPVGRDRVGLSEGEPEGEPKRTWTALTP